MTPVRDPKLGSFLLLLGHQMLPHQMGDSREGIGERERGGRDSGNIQETPRRRRRHPGGTQRHPEDTRRHPGDSQETSRRPRGTNRRPGGSTQGGSELENLCMLFARNLINVQKSCTYTYGF